MYKKRGAQKNKQRLNTSADGSCDVQEMLLLHTAIGDDWWRTALIARSQPSSLKRLFVPSNSLGLIQASEKSTSRYIVTVTTPTTLPCSTYITLSATLSVQDLQERCQWRNYANPNHQLTSQFLPQLSIDYWNIVIR